MKKFILYVCIGITLMIVGSAVEIFYQSESLQLDSTEHSQEELSLK